MYITVSVDLSLNLFGIVDLMGYSKHAAFLIVGLTTNILHGINTLYMSLKKVRK
jgi:hypothetical protein